MEVKKQKNAATDTDTVNSQSDSLTDLTVADEQSDETKGGTGGHVRVFDGRTGSLIA
jgi:hypothetical protein